MTHPDIELRCAKCDQWWGVTRATFEERYAGLPVIQCDPCRDARPAPRVRIVDTPPRFQSIAHVRRGRRRDGDDADWKEQLREMGRR